MTLREVVEVLVHYGLCHRLLPSSEVYGNDATDVLGYIEHDTSNIVINSSMSIMEKRQTILHELIHADLHVRGIMDDEETVDKTTAAMFHKIYPEYRERATKGKKGKRHK